MVKHVCVREVICFITMYYVRQSITMLYMYFHGDKVVGKGKARNPKTFLNSYTPTP